MKKIITSITLTTCVALCAAVWPCSSVVVDLPAKPVKSTISAEIEAKLEENPALIISAENNIPEMEPVTETNPIKQAPPASINSPEPSQPAELSTKPLSQTAPVSAEPKPGTIAVINGVKYMWIPGFGWIKDEGGGSDGIPVDSDSDINKQVGDMGGGSVAEDTYENGNKIGIMGGADSHSEKVNPLQFKLPEPTDDIIYIELQPLVTKDSTPPDYRPGQ